MKEIIICIGISGSGKSTWTTNFIKENSNYLRVNRDDIRKTLVGNLDGYYQRADLNMIERNVTRIEEFITKDFSIDYRNIIIDNTNLKESYINRWIKFSEYYKYNLKFKLFHISLEEAKQRVYIRDIQQYEDSYMNINHKNLEYIEKQYQDYQNIKKFIEQNYKERII